MTLIGDRAQGRQRSRLRWLILGAVALCLISVLIGRAFLGEVVRYRGQEMHPAIQHGDWLFVDHQRALAVDDIVLVRASPRPVIRRLMLKSGQKVPQPRKSKRPRTVEANPPVIPPGQVFLSCERPQRCVGLPATGLTPITEIQGIVKGRWASPF
jgi:hypothetical protein